MAVKFQKNKFIKHDNSTYNVISIKDALEINDLNNLIKIIINNKKYIVNGVYLEIEVDKLSEDVLICLFNIFEIYNVQVINTNFGNNPCSLCSLILASLAIRSSIPLNINNLINIQPLRFCLKNYDPDKVDRTIRELKMQIEYSEVYCDTFLDMLNILREKSMLENNIRFNNINDQVLILIENRLKGLK